MALNAPLELMENPETVCSDGLATYKNFPSPEIAMETGLAGVPAGAPRDFRFPSLPSMVKPEMLPDPSFNTYRNCPLGVAATTTGPVPAENGPRTLLVIGSLGTASVPFPLTASSVTSLPAKLAT